MEYLEKLDKISNTNPHQFIHMKPLYRNPGSASDGVLATLSAIGFKQQQTKQEIFSSIVFST